MSEGATWSGWLLVGVVFGFFLNVAMHEVYDWWQDRKIS